MRDYLGIYRGIIKQRKRLEDLLSINRIDLLVEDFETACDFYLQLMHDSTEVLGVLSLLKMYEPDDKWENSPLTVDFLNQYYYCTRLLEDAAQGELICEKSVKDSISEILKLMISEVEYSIAVS